MFLGYREERLNFIRAKYVDKQFAEKMYENELDKIYELEEAVNKGDLATLLQTWAENVDFTSPLPSSVGTQVGSKTCINFISIEKWRNGVASSDIKRSGKDVAYSRFSHSEYVQFSN